MQAPDTTSVVLFRSIPAELPFLAATVVVPLAVTLIGIFLRRKNGAVESAFVDLYLFVAAIQFSSIPLALSASFTHADAEKFIAILTILGLITFAASFPAVDLQAILENRHFQKRVRNDTTLRHRNPTVVPRFPLARWTVAWLGVYILLAPTLLVVLIALKSSR